VTVLVNKTESDRDPLTEELVSEWHLALLGSPDDRMGDRSYLYDRCIPSSIIEEFELGWDRGRITIPVRDKDGMLVNVRRFKRNPGPGGNKILHTNGYGSPTRLNFLTSLDKGEEHGFWDEWTVVAGGEWDALSAIGQGIRAVCGTNGESAVPKNGDLELLRGLHVAVILDNDSAGRSAALKWCTALQGIAAEVRNVTLPREGMDLNNWYEDDANGSSIGLLKLIEAAPAFGAQRDPEELVRMAEAKVAEGESRNGTGFWLAAQMRDERYSIDDAWERALAPYQLAVEHSKEDAYSEREARESLASAYAQAPRRPSGKGSTHAASNAYLYPRTELGNAERLVAGHGGDVRYLPPFKKWIVWNSRRWEDDELGQVMRWMQDTVRRIRTEAFDVADEDERKKQTAWALTSESAAKLESSISLAFKQPDVSMLPKKFDTYPMLLNCVNGTVDLRTGELRSHRREDYCRRMIDVAYAPDAAAPMFDAFMERVQPDPLMRAFLQRAVGYSLTGRTDEQKFLLLHGSGANGKSTLVELIHDLLGQYATFLPASSLSVRNSDAIPNDIARLDGARFVSVMEFDDNAPLNERLIKQLTGGDTMTARFMRGEYFDFKPQLKLWISSNHRPVVKGSDDGIWRRFLLVDFPVKIPKSEIDPTLHQRIRDTELPGVLRWAVEGAMAWQREGLKPPASVLMATEGYRADSDLLGAFLDEECVVGSAESIAKGLIYDRYVVWCGNSGLRPDAKITFGRKLKEHPSLALTEAKIGKRKTDVWVGLGLQLHQTIRLVPADNVTPISGGSNSAGQFASDAETTDAPTDASRRSRK
jgi:P4 family phage/plasmid primase-like protien